MISLLKDCKYFARLVFFYLNFFLSFFGFHNFSKQMKDKKTTKAYRDQVKERGWDRFQRAMWNLAGGCQSATTLKRDYGTFTVATWREHVRAYRKRWRQQEKDRLLMEQETKKIKGSRFFFLFLAH